MLLPERMWSVHGYADELRHEDSVARTHGIRFIVREMGNGVFRMESSVLDPLAYIQKDALRHGRYLIEPPFQDWMMDMVDAAIRNVGVDPCPVLHRTPSLAYARMIGENRYQFLGWRHPSFFKSSLKSDHTL